MEPQNHYEYYLRRAEAARRLERNALSPGVAGIHRQMAEQYEAMVEALAPNVVRLDQRVQAA